MLQGYTQFLPRGPDSDFCFAFPFLQLVCNSEVRGEKEKISVQQLEEVHWLRMKLPLDVETIRIRFPAFSPEKLKSIDLGKQKKHN